MKNNSNARFWPKWLGNFKSDNTFWWTIGILAFLACLSPFALVGIDDYNERKAPIKLEEAIPLTQLEDFYMAIEQDYCVRIDFPQGDSTASEWVKAIYRGAKNDSTGALDTRWELRRWDEKKEEFVIFSNITTHLDWPTPLKTGDPAGKIDGNKTIYWIEDRGQRQPCLYNEIDSTYYYFYRIPEES